jgi:AhpD family alkylhydroperoxidase
VQFLRINHQNKNIMTTLELTTRFSMKAVQPKAYKAIGALDQYMETTSLPPLYKEMIKIRASQLNGCAYCVDAHTGDARKLGETERRLNLICVWKEAQDIFTEEEQVILAMTEEITLIHQQGLTQKTYHHAVALFGEEKTAHIMMGIIAINAWNRIGVGLKMKPE